MSSEVTTGKHSAVGWCDHFSNPEMETVSWPSINPLLACVLVCQINDGGLTTAPPKEKIISMDPTFVQHLFNI